MLDTFARSGHQSTGFLQSVGSKPVLSKDVHGYMPRNTSSADVTEGGHKVCACVNMHVLSSLPAVHW